MSNRMIRTGALLLCAWAGATAQAGLFDDDEARRAILDLRQKVEAIKQDAEQQTSKSTDDNAQLRRSMLELQNQLELMRSDVARLVGQNEQLAKDLAETQRQYKELQTSTDERLRKFEPAKVVVDGREFLADLAEKRDYEAALGIFRKGDFPGAQAAFVDFIRRYPTSGYAPSAFFWLGNAQYATRDYNEAVQNFRNLLTQAPDHLRAPEAVLSIANCQVELKDIKAARKTLEDLVKGYPQSEAAAAAKQRLARLKS